MDEEMRGVLSRVLNGWFGRNRGWEGSHEDLLGTLLVDLEDSGLTITRITPPYEDPVVPEDVATAKEWKRCLDEVFERSVEHAAGRPWKDYVDVTVLSETVRVHNADMMWDAFAAHFSVHSQTDPAYDAPMKAAWKELTVSVRAEQRRRGVVVGACSSSEASAYDLAANHAAARDREG